VDANLVKSSTAGGDYSGRTAEAALRDAEQGMENLELNQDYAIARQLQAEEDAITRDRRRAARAAQREGPNAENNATPSAETLAAGEPTRDPLGRERRTSARSASKRGKGECCIM